MPSQQVFRTKDNAVYTTSTGAPIAEPYAAQRIATLGPLLLQDFHHIDLLAHFDRERIPERVVHAKGAGAHGYFVATHDLSDITSCKLFTSVGKKVPVTVRFSTVGGESGSADTARDPRGFAIKLKTDDGNLDWVFNNTPVFFLRDPAKFPHFIHTQKRDPQTHLKDPDMYWDYLSQNPESAHQVMILFSDRGTPDGYHNMHGYSGHTFKLVKDDGSFVYAQVHVRADGGFKTLDHATATRLAGEQADYGTQALFETIEAGKYPSWTVYVQTMTPEQAENFRYNILDLTKNPQNYFAEIEQAAFSPSHTIPYWEPTADPVLQSRLFSYPDTHRHRLGVNYNQIPVNAPLTPAANFQRDGSMAFNNQGARPNYQSSIVPLSYTRNKGSMNDEVHDYQRASKHETWLGGAFLDLSEVTELDFEQPRALYWKAMSDTDRQHLISNIAGHLGGVKSPEVRDRTLSYFACVDQSLSDRIASAIDAPTAKPLPVKPASEAVRFRTRFTV
ncbi:catalase [Pisolithus croceorrhizus]|nr:catalase [Pisolithus croceorrhizus]